MLHLQKPYPHSFTYLSPRGSLGGGVFSLSWPAFLFQSRVNTISLVFLSSLRERDTEEILFPPIFPLLPSSPPKLDRKRQELPHPWDLKLSAQSNRGAAAESHLCIALCNVASFANPIRKIHLMKRFLRKKKKRLFPFIVRWESLARKAVNSWIIWYLNQSTIASPSPGTLCGSLKWCSRDYRDTFQSYSAAGAGRSLSNQ